MEKCEMLKAKKAYTLYFSDEKRKQILKQGNYIIKTQTVLCEIVKGRCPYENDGRTMSFTNSPIEKLCICNSDGLVEKTGLLKIETGMTDINMS